MNDGTVILRYLELVHRAGPLVRRTVRECRDSGILAFSPMRSTGREHEAYPTLPIVLADRSL
jgi:hypothetical protein